jgi:hypothetical protein
MMTEKEEPRFLFIRNTIQSYQPQIHVRMNQHDVVWLLVCLSCLCVILTSFCFILMALQARLSVSACLHDTYKLRAIRYFCHKAKEDTSF